jgi:hypothetical protein
MKSGLKKNDEARMTNGGKLNRYKVKRLKVCCLDIVTFNSFAPHTDERFVVI